MIDKNYNVTFDKEVTRAAVHCQMYLIEKYKRKVTLDETVLRALNEYFEKLEKELKK